MCSHTIREPFRWKGTSGDPQSNLLLKVGSTLNSDQVAQGFVHLSCKNLQGWGFHSLSRPCSTAQLVEHLCALGATILL